VARWEIRAGESGNVGGNKEHHSSRNNIADIVIVRGSGLFHSFVSKTLPRDSQGTATAHSSWS
jgi:hypothetical protein